VAAASDVAQVKAAREDIRELLRTTYCHPILVRAVTLVVRLSYIIHKLHQL
jgi:hypothetical protein